MLKINEVLNVEGTLFRILTILPHSVIWININLKNAFPSEVIKTEILKGLENLNIKRDIIIAAAEEPILTIHFLSNILRGTVRLRERAHAP